jgi:predicted DNA-binding transcriptional regulator AlpA
MDPEDRLLSMKEAVEYLDHVVSRATLYREQNDRRLAYVRIRSRRYVWRSELIRYVHDRTEAA